MHCQWVPILLVDVCNGWLMIGVELYSGIGRVLVLCWTRIYVGFVQSSVFWSKIGGSALILHQVCSELANDWHWDSIGLTSDWWWIDTFWHRIGWIDLCASVLHHIWMDLQIEDARIGSPLVFDWFCIAMDWHWIGIVLALDGLPFGESFLCLLRLERPSAARFVLREDTSVGLHSTLVPRLVTSWSPMDWR